MWAVGVNDEQVGLDMRHQPPSNSPQRGEDIASPPAPLSPDSLARLWLGFGLCALAGLYTHLYTGFLWPAVALWLLLNPKPFKRVWLPFGLTMGTVTLLFLPLAWANWRFSSESTPGDPFSGAAERAFSLFSNFAIWQAPLSEDVRWWLLFGLSFFLFLGLLMAFTKRQGWLILLLLSMPFVIASALMLRSDLAFFGPRYFIVMLPWMFLLQAVGGKFFVGPNGEDKMAELKKKR